MKPQTSTRDPRSRPGRPRTGEPVVTHEQILSVALRFFAVNGFEATSVRAICDELGVSHNFINERLGTKLDLWRSVVDHYYTWLLDELRDNVAAHSPDADPVDVLRSYLVRVVELTSEEPDLSRLGTLEASTETDRLEYLWSTYIDPTRKLIATAYRRAVRDGHIRPFPPGVMFFLVNHGALAPPAHGPMARRLGMTDPTDPDVVRTTAEFVAELLLSPPSEHSSDSLPSRPQ